MGESALGAPAREAGSVLEVAEGNDFTSLELGNPWNMDSFTDISQCFNGDLFHITNFSVSNGVFSGQSTNAEASFYVLHPGYLPGMRSGTIGYLHPIDPNKYSCAYVASYVPPDSSPRYYWFVFPQETLTMMHIPKLQIVPFQK